jgi:sugar lactone lactonase YvrE
MRKIAPSFGIMAVLLFSAFLSVPAAHAFVNGQNAAIVIGQPNFTSSTGGDTQNTLNDPQGIAFDSSGNLWVADATNGRVLEFKAPLSTGESASVVSGQASFTAQNANCFASSTIAASCLGVPEGMAFDSHGDLWVVDSGNGRIVEFTPPFTNDENASVAIGVPNLTTADFAPNAVSASGLNLPGGISFDTSGNLWVADTLNNRVLEFKAPLTTGENAGVVLGQDNFTSNTPLYSSGCPQGQECPTAVGLTAPDGVTVDSSGNVWTAERGTGRILEFKAPISTGESASLVLGQAKLTTFGDAGGFYCSAVTPANFCVEPDSLTFDSSGRIWVADTDYYRVLAFNPPFTTNETASLVLGFDNFTAIPPIDQNASASDLSIPESVAIDSSGNVWVSDSGQNRVVEFPASATGTTSGASSSSVSTSSSAQTSSGSSSSSSAATIAQSSVSQSSVSSTSSSSSASSVSLSFGYIAIVLVVVLMELIVSGLVVVGRRRRPTR